MCAAEGGDPVVVQRNVCLMMLREALALTAMFFVIHISIAKTITQQKKVKRGLSCTHTSLH